MAEPRILVVNAQPIIAEALALLIARYTQFVTNFCLTRSTVVDCIHSFEPKVVLISLNDPEVEEELCLCRTIAAATADRMVVIVAPGFVLADQRLIADAFDAGADGVLNQDTLTVEELIVALHKLAAGQPLWDMRELGQAMLHREEATRASDPVAAMGQLTPREREIFAMLATGAANKDIADALHISERTVQKHISNLLIKLGVNSRTQALAIYYQWQPKDDYARHLAT